MKFDLVELISRIILIMLYALMAKNCWHSFEKFGNVSSLIFLMEELLIVVMVTFRKPSKQVSKRGEDWLIAIMATVTPLFARSFGHHDNIYALAIQIGGILFSIAALLSLNQSFGIIPANRGIKSAGTYRFVRHPVYAGYAISYVGFLWNQFYIYNVVVILVWVLFVIPRILKEEALLKQDEQYRQFASRVKWRLVPYVW